MTLPCNYCGLENDLQANAFFSHPVCSTCFLTWYEFGHPLTPAELGFWSRAEQATAPKTSEVTP